MGNGSRRSRWGFLFGLASLTLAVSPVVADTVDGVPVFDAAQTSSGATARQPITPPGDGFVPGTAESSDPDVAKVEETPGGIRGDQGVTFTVGKKRSVAAITITWTNPKTREKRKTFVLVVNTSGMTILRVVRATHTEGETKRIQTNAGGWIEPDPKRKPGTYVDGYPAWGGVGVVIVTVEPKSASGPRTAPPTPKQTAPDEGGNKE